MTSHSTWAEKLRYFAEGVAEKLEVGVDVPTPEQFAVFVNTPRLCPFKFRLGIVHTPEPPPGIHGGSGDASVVQGDAGLCRSP